MRLKDSNKNAISLLHRVIHIAIFIHVHERKAQKECFARIIHTPPAPPAFCFLMWEEQKLKAHHCHLFNAGNSGLQPAGPHHAFRFRGFCCAEDHDASMHQP